MHTALIPTVARRTACLAGSLDLFGSPEIRLGKLYMFLCAGHLALMSFCESFVHTGLILLPACQNVDSARDREQD